MALLIIYFILHFPKTYSLNWSISYQKAKAFLFTKRKLNNDYLLNLSLFVGLNEKIVSLIIRYIKPKISYKKVKVRECITNFKEVEESDLLDYQSYFYE